MSDGITDMHREEEKKAAEMVEKCCRNCDYRKCNMGSLCLPCSNNSNFTPSRSAIAAKVEELRKQEESCEKDGGESCSKSERAEMIEALMSAKTLFAFRPNITDQEVILMDKINTILKKAEASNE